MLLQTTRAARNHTLYRRLAYPQVPLRWPVPSTASATDFRTFPRDMKKGLTITRKPFIYNEFLVGSASFELATPAV